MTNTDYLEIISKLKDGHMMMWGHIMDEDNEVILSTVDSIISNMDYSTNRDFAISLLASILNNGRNCGKESPILYTLSHYYWVSKVLEIRGNYKGDIYPPLDDITNPDFLFIDNILEHTNHMFINILENTIKKVKDYISSKVHVELVDGILCSADGSYVDIDAGHVRYGHERRVDSLTYTNKTITVEHVLIKRKQLLKDVSVNNMIQLLIAYSITVNHNTNNYKLSFRNRDFIDYKKLIGIIKDGGTISDALVYISKLATNVIAISLTAQSNPTKSISNKHVDTIKGEYTVISTNPIDVSTVNPSHGLLLVITNNNVSVVIQHDNITFTLVNVIRFCIPESTFKGNIEMIVDNLSMGEGTRILDIIRIEFDKLGILDLYLQPPRILNTSINDFMSMERDVHVSNSRIQGESVYFISGDTMNIGYLDGNTFITIVLIGSYGGELPGSRIMFTTSPNVKRVTKQVKSELKRFFGPEHYKMFRGRIDL